MAQHKDDLRHLTTCSVCMETYSDPRILSCIHTFCLRCLEQTTRNAEKANESPRCPLCRQAFRLPNEGVGAVAKNFFMENLIEMLKVARPDDDIHLCGFCVAELQADCDAAYVPEARVYCSDCREFICDDCSRHHRKQTPTRNHNVVPLGTGAVPTEVTSRSNCDKHSSEQIKLFCINCSCAVCLLCFVESHTSHECSDINKVVKDHRQQIQRNVETVSALLPKTVHRIETVKESRITAIGKLGDLEERINVRVEELKATIEDHQAILLSELAERKTRVLKQIDVQQSETERHRAILESFTTYCKELLSRASSIDICRCSGDLSKRTNDLQLIHRSQYEKPVSVYEASYEKFDLEKALNYERENILGKIEDNFAAIQKTECHSRDSQVVPRQLTKQAEIEFPEYWNLKKHQQTNYQQNFLEPLGRSQLLNEVTSLFSKTVVSDSFHEYGLRRHQWQGSPSQCDVYARNPAASFFQIQNIWSVQNPDLYRRYAAKRELFQINSLVNDYVDLKQTIGSDVCTFKPEFGLLNGQLSSTQNERYLVYSSTAQMYQSVIVNGFPLTNSLQETIITGLGIHFVDSITINTVKQKSNEQSILDRHQRHRSRVNVIIKPQSRVGLGKPANNYAFLSRVLLGDIFVCKERGHFDGLPCRVGGCFGNRCNHHYKGTFDSVVGLADVEGSCSRDFVIFDPDQTYPEFLVQYSQ